GVMRLDQGNQPLPRHHPIHLDQEQLFAGLLALAGVLGIGEGHLLHQKTRWGGVRLFCQNQKVFFRLSLTVRSKPWLHQRAGELSAKTQEMAAETSSLSFLRRFWRSLAGRWE